MKLRRNHSRKVGLEINDTWLQAAEISEQPEGIEVIQAERAPLAPGIVEEGRVVQPGLLTAAVSELWRQAGFQSREVNFGIPNSIVLIRHYQLPSAERAELRNMLDMELQLRTRLPFSDPIFDFVIYAVEPCETVDEEEAASSLPLRHDAQQEAAAGSVMDREDQGLWRRIGRRVRGALHREPAQGQPGGRSNILLAAVPGAEMIRYRDALEAASLQPRVFDIKPLAVDRLLPRISLAEEACTYVTASIHARHTDIFLFHRGQLRLTRSLSIKSDSISRKQRESSPSGGAWPGEKDWEAVCEELALELERLVDFYRYSSPQDSEPIQFVFLCGDIDGLGHICPVLGRMLQMPAFVLEAADGLTTSLEAPLHPFAVPISLACEGGRRA
ncbi:pilus assembly protein PilM [Paenibacillus dendritiformis]|uniref:type IV pilus biogenesis protein PilM n=1 Tax=Paenibacillus dendritiformis TaxID=130049 RepID=UPI001059A2E3|nr:pilus assembly protein PilM [Paenibacillus dendritiformis]TDL57733.1 pilus assembly protein PilM [Paenibacillus dendritiformis]